jgi:hypothetical protein
MSKVKKHNNYLEILEARSLKIQKAMMEATRQGRMRKIRMLMKLLGES